MNTSVQKKQEELLEMKTFHTYDRAKSPSFKEQVLEKLQTIENKCTQLEEDHTRETTEDVS